LIKDKYPDIEPFLKMKGESIKLPEGLSAALGRAQVVADESDFIKRVTIIAEKGKFFVRGQGSHGWVEEDVPAEYEGKRLEFMASPEYLKEILRVTNKAVIGENALLFEGKEFKHLVALMGD
jgi:DNA polymerase III sliding clamp (beta) subunit (PCNA family)